MKPQINFKFISKIIFLIIFRGSSWNKGFLKSWRILQFTVICVSAVNCIQFFIVKYISKPGTKLTYQDNKASKKLCLINVIIPSHFNTDQVRGFLKYQNKIFKHSSMNYKFSVDAIVREWACRGYTPELPSGEKKLSCF